jgi:hypothetical protein
VGIYAVCTKKWGSAVHFDDNVVYHFFNKEWFAWTVVIATFILNIMSPLIVWYILGGKWKLKASDKGDSKNAGMKHHGGNAEG